MKIIIIDGSLRKNDGISKIYIKSMEKSFSKMNVDFSVVHLVEANINICKGCLSCVKGNQHQCIQDDDMTEIRERIMTCDKMIFIAPIYYANISSIMKMFIERLLPLCSSKIYRFSDGYLTHQCKPNVPELIVFSTCSLPDKKQFNVLKEYVKLLEKNMQTKLIVEMYRTQASIIDYDFPGIKVLIKEYKKNIEKACEEIVNHNCISKKTIFNLERPLIANHVYLDFLDKLVI